MLNGISSQFSGISSNLLLQQKPAGRMDPEQMAEEFAANLIEELDSDGDGALSIEETGFSEEMFAEADADGDGLLTSDEIKADMQRRHEAMREELMAKGFDDQKLDEMVTNLIEELDSDGDGALSIEETGFSEEMFAEADTDGDGLLTSDEIKADIQSKHEAMMNGPMPPPPPPPDDEDIDDIVTNLIEELDSDGDGALSIAETGFSEEMFAEADADGDGLLTSDEIKADMQSKHEAMGRGPMPIEQETEQIPAEMTNQSAVQAYLDNMNSLLSALLENENNSSSSAYAASVSGALDMTA